MRYNFDLICTILLFYSYRYIVIVTVGEKLYQGYNSLANFLWDAEKDGYLKYVYETPKFFAVATFYYIYYDWLYLYIILHTQTPQCRDNGNIVKKNTNKGNDLYSFYMQKIVMLNLLWWQRG